MRYLFCFIFIIQVINVYGQEQNISKQRQAQNEQQYLDSLINQYAPNFKAKTLNGEYFDLSKHKGKVILINFWSLSCVYCFKEIVDFNRIVEERKDDNFILVSLMDNSIEDLNKNIISNGDFYKLLKPIFENDLINYEIIPNSKEVMKKYKLGQGFPKTFFVDEDGRIRDFVNGYFVHYEGIPDQLSNYEQLNNRINKLLK